MKKITFVFLSIIIQTFFLYGQGFPGIWGNNDPFSVMDKAINDSEDTFTPMDEYYLGRAVAANILVLKQTHIYTKIAWVPTLGAEIILEYKRGLLGSFKLIS